MNKNQYGFTPQRSTIDAAMAVKDFLGEGLNSGEVLVIASLDMKGAFDAAWWSSILKSPKENGCPEKLYKVTKSYFSQRTAIMSTYSIRMKREVKDAHKIRVAVQDSGTFITTLY
jgi:hypothetical protein